MWWHTRRNQILSFGETDEYRRGTSVQSTTGSRGVHISGSNAGYTMFQGSVKGAGYPLHSPVSPSIPLLCVTVCHHIWTGVYICMFCISLCWVSCTSTLLLGLHGLLWHEFYLYYISAEHILEVGIGWNISDWVINKLSSKFHSYIQIKFHFWWWAFKSYNLLSPL